MRITNVIPAKRWQHPDGRTASIYGAVPYHGEQGDWVVVQVGWTFGWSNGTIGTYSRPPFGTEDEARAAMTTINGKVRS